VCRANETCTASGCDEKRREAWARNELLEVTRLGEKSALPIKEANKAPSSRGTRFDQPSSVQRQTRLARPNLRAGEPLAVQRPGHAKRISHGAQGRWRIAPEAMSSRDPLHPLGVILERPGVDPGTARQAERRLLQTRGTFLDLHSICRADRDEITIGEMIQAARLQSSTQR
jgi:hypothetical protein